MKHCSPDAALGIFEALNWGADSCKFRDLHHVFILQLMFQPWHDFFSGTHTFRKTWRTVATNNIDTNWWNYRLARQVFGLSDSL